MFERLFRKKTPPMVKRCRYCHERLDGKELYSVCLRCSQEVRSRKDRCPLCGGRTVEICRYDTDDGKRGCGNPVANADVLDVALAAVGTRRSGKSTFVDMLADTLEGRHAGGCIVASPPAVPNPDADARRRGEPFMLTVDTEDGGVNLILHDIPGGDLADTARLLRSDSSAKIRDADIVALMVDPLKIDRVREALGIDAGSSENSNRTAAIIGRLKGMCGGKKLAVVLSKADLLTADVPGSQYLFGPGSAIHGLCNGDRYDTETVENEVREFLSAVDCLKAVQETGDTFSQIRYFATGTASISDERSFKTRRYPFGAAELLKWVLSEAYADGCRQAD